MKKVSKIMGNILFAASVCGLVAFSDNAIISAKGADEVLVTLDGDVGEKKIDKITKGLADGYEIISGKFDINNKLPKKKRERLKKYLKKKDYKTIVAVDVKNKIGLMDAMDRIEDKSGVESVDCNFSTTEVESIDLDDTFVGKQTYLSNINVEPAWKDIKNSRLDTQYVAVIDSGLQVKNPDFAGMYLDDYSVDIRSEVDGGYEKLSAQSKPDEMGHGTHVAGIIAAKANNRIGTAGVATGGSNDVCKLMAIKAVHIYDDPKRGMTMKVFEDADVVKAIQYAVANGADVINMSIAGRSHSDAVQTAINNAYEAGVLVVAAKGNASLDTTDFPYYPSDYENVISVSATDSANKLAGFSNYGNVDIAAPGDSIESSSNTTNSAGLMTMSGTSMATPMVTATIAMMKSLGITSNSKCEKILYNTAQNIGSSLYYGHGLLDAGYAVQKANYECLTNLKDPAPSAYAVWTKNYCEMLITLRFNRYADGYRIYVSGGDPVMNFKCCKTIKRKSMSAAGVSTRINCLSLPQPIRNRWCVKVRPFIYSDYGSDKIDGEKIANGPFSQYTYVTVPKKN